MPINKNALKRFQIIDECLSDPNRDYTTEQILRKVNSECEKVTLRMIQKDILAISSEFGKNIVRNAGGLGTVKYVDQSQPIFYKELTNDEEELLREVLKCLGQFEGLDNFSWLDLLKKKFDVDSKNNPRPVIVFSKNEGLQIPETLLGRLFTAISRKKVIRITYTVFGGDPKQYSVYPYQLKQFNDRWFLLCTPLATEEFPYSDSFIATFALDRIDKKFEYLEDEPYVDTPVDLKSRFDEIIGVTLFTEKEPEEIVFAVNKSSLPYVRTKYLHFNQIELEGEWEAEVRKRYPNLPDWTFFSIECRPNHELYNRFASYADSIIILEPASIRNEIASKMKASAENYHLILNQE